MIYDKLFMKYNNWSSIEHIENNNTDEQDSEDLYKCTCSCGTVEIHKGDELIYDKLRMCNNCMRHDNVERQRKRYEDMTFGSWHVENFIGNRKYICLCKECGTRYEKVPAEFERGKSSKCKNCAGLALKDLKGKTFGSYYVIEYVGNHYWKCKCTKCGTIKNITSQHLTLDGNTECIDCSNKDKGVKLIESTVNSLLGKQFGNLVVTGYNYETHKYICECQCSDKSIIEVTRSNLKNGCVKSCGCLTNKLKRDTMMLRYGDVSSKRINNPRVINNIEDIENKDKFIIRYNKLQEKLGRVPRAIDVAKEFDVTTPIALKYAHKYNVEIDTDTSGYSICEFEITELLNNVDIRMHVRNVIGPQELDIYIPEKKIAIEFNGDYWHSTEKIDKYYHQQKTITCAKQGIRLIHIFEHEWKDEKTRKKLEYIIREINNSNVKKVRASDLNIRSLNANECKDFLDEYHLQNNAFSEIRLGLCNKDELLSVMTFGKPRFNNNFEYELVRFCTKPGYRIYGAANKLFKYFVNNYRPKSIVTYCDVAKFTGNTYINLGFSCSIDDITEPNYVWVNSELNVLTRYQTQKHLLVKFGLGDTSQTEDQIMKSMKYYKVYNSGNLKLSWFNNN